MARREKEMADGTMAVVAVVLTEWDILSFRCYLLREGEGGRGNLQ